MKKNTFRIHHNARTKNASLIVGWQTRDVGKIGYRVTAFLKEKLTGEEVGEIEPLGFFPLGGAVFSTDIVQVPQSQFFASDKNNLVVFASHEPRYEWHAFLSALLDFGQYNCAVERLYTVGGTISSIAHTTPRRVFAVFNDAELQKNLQVHTLEQMTWEGPPATSSYLLWVAKNRGTPGVSLWVEVPFYLATREDPEAIRQCLAFLDSRFNLNLDLSELELQRKKQYEGLAKLRRQNSEVNKCLEMLERGLSLSSEEQLNLSKEVSEFL